MLLDNDHVLLTAVCEVTQSTEIDKVAKSLVYIFYHHNKALDMLRDRVVSEIKTSGK